MIPFEIAPSAHADLENIRAYLAIELDNLELAERTLDELHLAMRKLSRSPGIGHFRTDLAPPPFRFWRVQSYLIVYRLSDILEVVRIVHASRDFPDLPD